MFNRGSGSGVESKRTDESFYSGIVVKNDDPLKLNRVKIYIPELSNQPFDNWFEEYDEINVKIAGVNNPTDNWNDIAIFKEIANTIPWAEPCYPIIGESGNARYYQNDEDSISTISDCNYEEGFQVNDKEPPTLQTGSFSPAFIYENKDTIMGDAFNKPIDAFSVKCNTYSFGYKSQKFSNKTKGFMGVPEVGSKVWVFHYMGDLNFPVYFGVIQDYRSLTLINRTDNESNISPYYPSDFEN
jgi:hypothetical protein